MAGWGAKKNKKDCVKCRRMQKASSFERGARVRIAGLGDCKNCEVMKNSPIDTNENIVALYNALPREGGVTASGIHVLFEVFEIPQELRFDYYQRLTYLHNEMLGSKDKVSKKETEDKKAVDQWKRQRFSVGRRTKRTH